MNCACIKNDYRFTVDVLDGKSIIYRDISTWMVGFNYLDKATYELQLTLPGHVKPKKFNVNNYENVKLVLGQVIDGVYRFSVDNCGTSYERCEAIIPNLQCCVDKIVAELKFDDKLDKLLCDLESFKACVKIGDFENASELFKILKRSVKNFKCNCANCL